MSSSLLKPIELKEKNIFSRNNANISRNNANVSRYNANISRYNANVRVITRNIRVKTRKNIFSMSSIGFRTSFFVVLFNNILKSGT